MKKEDLELLAKLQLWHERRSHLYSFMRYLMPELIPNWHFEVICARLERLVYETNQRIVILLPPQTGKSTIVSRFLPTFLLGHLPSLKIVLGSYSANLADSFCRDAQRIMDNPRYGELFDTKIPSSRATQSKDAKRSGNFFETVDHYGYLKTVGVGGSLTGSRADLLLIDDPCKGRAEADSAVYQRRVLEWYQSVAETRCSKNANRIIMHTPWSQRDLSFHLMSMSKEDPNAPEWELLKFPAIAEGELHPQDPREQGEPIFEKFYGDIKAMAVKKATVGLREWASLYQCSPVAAGGQIIKDHWIRRYDSMPETFDSVILSWDLRFSKNKDANDWVAGHAWGIKGSRMFLIDREHGRWSFTESVQAFQRMVSRWPEARAKLVEKKANGDALEDVLCDAIKGIILVEPKGDKTQRLMAVEHLFEAGNVYFPRTAWGNAVIHELTTFPTAAHDDDVDACTQALMYLEEKSGKLQSMYKRLASGASYGGSIF